MEVAKVLRANCLRCSPAPVARHGDPVDQRTDIWAWGIVLFEMLCGRAPFRAEKRRALMRAILSEQHELTAFLESTVPSGLVQVLSKALQKDPAERYLRIDEALSELQRSGPPGTDLQGRPKLVAGVRAVPSIAVLPFRSLSADAEHEYFSPGLTEELTGALARLDGLQVASPTAVIALKGVPGRSEES